MQLFSFLTGGEGRTTPLPTFLPRGIIKTFQTVKIHIQNTIESLLLRVRAGTLPLQPEKQHLFKLLINAAWLSHVSKANFFV